MFRRDGSYPPALGLTFLHGTTVGVRDEAGDHESSDEASERSNGAESDEASVGKQEQTDMSFSFCFSHNDCEQDRPANDSESSFPDISCDSSPLALSQEGSLPAAASSLSSDLSNGGGPLSSTGHLFLLHRDGSDSEQDDNESSAQDEDSTSLASAGSLSDWIDNCASMEAQFESHSFPFAPTRIDPCT